MQYKNPKRDKEMSCKRPLLKEGYWMSFLKFATSHLGDTANVEERTCVKREFIELFG